MGFRNVPEIDVQAFAGRLADNPALVVLDVREPYELKLAHLNDGRVALAPLSALAEIGLDALPAAAQVQQAEIVVLCHHGVRSVQVTAWLRSQGWTNVFSLRGGIDAYASAIDPAVGHYY